MKLRQQIVEQTRLGQSIYMLTLEIGIYAIKIWMIRIRIRMHDMSMNPRHIDMHAYIFVQQKCS